MVTMTQKQEQDQPKDRDPDERVAIPLDAEVALRALLTVDPEAKPGKKDAEPTKRDQTGRRAS